MHQAFANAGLDASQVTEVEMSPSNFSAAFSSGQVDAIATFDQNLASAMVTPGAKLLVNAEDYGNLNVSIHIVSQSFADQHPDLVKAMYRALVKESDKAQDPRDPADRRRRARHAGTAGAAVRGLRVHRRAARRQEPRYGLHEVRPR